MSGKRQISKANLMLSEAAAVRRKSKTDKEVSDFSCFKNKNKLKLNTEEDEENVDKEKDCNLNHMFKIMNYLEKDKQLETGRKELRVFYF